MMNLALLRVSNDLILLTISIHFQAEKVMIRKKNINLKILFDLIPNSQRQKS